MKIKFSRLEFPIYVTGDGTGFLSQWCCSCGARHIWHFKIYKGDKTTGGPFIEINMMGDETGTQLRKFYERHLQKKATTKRRKRK